MTDTTEFRKGQRVRVEFAGIVASTSAAWNAVVVDVSGSRQTVYLEEGVTVTLAEPEGFPVRAGDVWKKGDHLWFAQISGLSGTLFMVPDDMRFLPRMTPGDFKEGVTPVLKWRNP